MRRLTDLSLFHNKISELKGLDAQKDTLEVRWGATVGIDDDDGHHV